jgi:hypothetical protein
MIGTMRIVVWKYQDHRGKQIVKRGQFIKLVRHGYFREPGEQQAIVHWSGNKNPSYAPLSELSEEPREQYHLALAI